MAWWVVWWKNKIRGFWDVKVEMIYKCPQMNTIKFLVHESFRSVGIAHGQIGLCTTTQLDGLVGCFVKKWNSWFLTYEGWNGLQMSPNEIPWKSWSTKVEFCGFCTWPSWSVHHGIAKWFVGCFVKKWNSWFLSCEGWNGLQMSPNKNHESLYARKFWVRGVLHMAKFVSAPRHS